MLNANNLIGYDLSPLILSSIPIMCEVLYIYVR